MGSETAIYVRQSEDKSGHEAAVQRQEVDCRAQAKLKGWDDPVLYADNSISATTGKTRPAFERLLRDIEAGTVTALVVWHMDRLTRSMKDLTRVIESGQKHGLNIVGVKGGSLDLGDASGIMNAQILTAVAAAEVARKGERQRLANKTRAGKGEAFWTRRPFGYDRKDGKVFTVKAEADAIRDAAAMILAGETLSAVVRKWNAAGLTTTTKQKGQWGVTQVRRVLLNPRYAGHRLYNGEQQEKAGQWTAILSSETSKRLEEVLTDPRRRTAPDDLNSKYLLSGIALCGKCGAKMFAAPVPAKGGGKRMVYRCFGGYCMQRSLPDIDSLVVDHVVGRLSMPDAAQLFVTGDTTAELRRKSADLRDRRSLLVSLAAEGMVDAADVREQAGRLTGKIAEVEAAIAAADVYNPAAALSHAADVGKAWADLPLGTQRKIIRALLTVTILPAGRGKDFDPDQVDIKWL